MKENKIVLYEDNDKNVVVKVAYHNETFWLNKRTIAELFDTSVDNVSLHLKNIYSDGELNEESTSEDFSVVQKEGNRNVNRTIKFYNLDAIIAVGYRVSSKEATKFRIWATKTLKEYITKGFVLNDDFLKNGKKFGKDYFDELLERIRDIRSSERRAYQKITDIYQTVSADYNKESEETKLFYKMIQNKLHFAITGETAAEIIYTRADSEKPYMGLTTWKGSPNEKILRSDTHVAKNYLNKKELDKLNRLVTMFIDYAEYNTLEENILTMNDLLKITDKFLTFNNSKLLDNAGKISHKLAVARADEEYNKFKIKQDQDYISDFDEVLDKYLKGNDNE